MRRTDKPNGPEALAQPGIHGDDVSTMPEAFAGMYQTGYDEGYASGKEAGFRRGFEAGFTAAHKRSDDAGVMSAAEVAPAPKRGPRRLLVGLPCINCGAYFDRDETHCTACKFPQRPTPARNDLLLQTPKVAPTFRSGEARKRAAGDD
jgi:hypothetical protein